MSYCGSKCIENMEGQGTMQDVLSNHRENISILAAWAMYSRGLEAEFSHGVFEQLSLLSGHAKESGYGVHQMTQLLWCSIDNDDSRDLDQISSIEQLEQGKVRVFVAVSDVDSVVKKGSPIDEHARLNTTSVYSSARVFPMLPEQLCTDLTSLNQDQDRLALITEMTFSGDGLLIESNIYRAVVRNKAKLAYDAVSEWFEGVAELPESAQKVAGMDTQLRMQDELAQKLRLLRRSQGSLELETFQPHAVYDGDIIIDIRQQPHNRARQLIEELMIATNGCTARFLAEQGTASLRRVVRSPERWQRIVEVAESYGWSLPDEPDGEALQAFLAMQHQADPLRFPDLSLVIIKLMGRGEYVVERPRGQSIGHFGLAVQDYMHSTAPNRRYPDLITLRLLKSTLAGEKSPYTYDELEALATHCTTQEDAAQKVERQVRKSEAALLLHDRRGEIFAGLIIGVGERGTWVRIFKPPAEGRLKGDLPTLNVGQKVKVKLVSTSVERGFIDFTIVH